MTKALRGLLEGLLYSEAPTALMGLCMGVLAARLLGQGLNPYLLGLQGLLPLLFYSLERNLTWLPPEQSNFPAKSRWLRANPRLNWGIIFISGLAALPLLATLHWPSLLLLGAGGAVALAYSLLPLPGLKPLKEIPLLKPLAIAFAWTIVTLGLPLQEGVFPASANVAALALFWWGGIGANTLLFDLRDQTHDAAQGRVTLVICFGPQRTLFLVCLALALQGGAAIWLVFLLGQTGLTAALSSACLWVLLQSLWLFRHPKPGFLFFLLADISFCLPALLLPLA